MYQVPFAAPLHVCGVGEPDLELPALEGTLCAGQGCATPGSFRQSISYLGKILVMIADTGAGI